MNTSSAYFWIHIIAATIAYLSFTFAFVAGLVYLYQDWQLKNHRLAKGPSLEQVERVMFRALLVGLPVLTVALLSGFIWLRQEFGTFWLWNSKVMASVFAWIVYSALFYFHYVSNIHGRKVVVLCVFAFSLILVIFLGMSLFEAQVHAYR